MWTNQCGKVSLIFFTNCDRLAGNDKESVMYRLVERERKDRMVLPEDLVLGTWFGTWLE